MSWEQAREPRTLSSLVGTCTRHFLTEWGIYYFCLLQLCLFSTHCSLKLEEESIIDPAVGELDT